MDTRFGPASQGLLQRLRRTPVTVSDLRDAAEDVLPDLRTPSLRVRLLDRSGDGPIMVLEEHERRLRVHLADLAEAMTAASVPATADGIRAALSAWIAHRPVTDEAAAAAGVAVLGWADAARTRLGWQVVVVRGAEALAWTPSRAASAETVARVRAAAHARGLDVAVQLRVEGPVALWTHRAVPLLATAALLDPEGMLARTAAMGLRFPAMHVVVTPGRPLACADAGVAARLAGDTSEPCVTLPWQRIADLPWG